MKKYKIIIKEIIDYLLDHNNLLKYKLNMEEMVWNYGLE